MQYRQTAALVNLGAIQDNVRKIIETYAEYTYYFGVVKADCYGLGGTEVIRAIIDGGCNYLCVSLTEEALFVREHFPEIPVLILVPSPKEALPVLQEKNIAVTVSSFAQAQEASQFPGLKIFIRANGGHDLFGGPTHEEDFKALLNQIRHSPAVLEGIYPHNYYPKNKKVTHLEYASFEAMIKNIDLDSIPIISTSSSLTLPRYNKKPYCNACRIGNMIYGIENDTLNLQNCFMLKSEITQILRLTRGDSISYFDAYTAQAPEEFVGVVPIGYGDGFSKNNVGRDVFINDRRFKIIAVTMDITLLAVDRQVKKGDLVLLIRDARHLDEIAAHTHGVAEEAICLLNQRIPRKYLRHF